MADPLVRKPWWFFIGGDNMCVTVFGRIWVPKSMWPTPPACVIAHEEVHLRQQARDGMLRWLWRYLTSKKWKLEYEVEGYAVQVKLYPADYNFAIQELCSADYGYVGGTPENAKAALDAAIAALAN